jgi:probable rRNA maturation factor
MRKKAPASGVRFHYLKPARFPGKRHLKKLLVRIGSDFKKRTFVLTYIFCSDEYLLDINNRFLKHDFYTDILTFDLSEGSKGVVGEIYISVDRVIENASKLNVRLSEEIARVMIHGALHLCGFRDKTQPDVKRMRAAEDRYLSLYQQTVPRETINKNKFHVKHRSGLS